MKSKNLLFNPEVVVSSEIYALPTQDARVMRCTPSDALRFLIDEKTLELRIPHGGTLPYSPLGIRELGIG